MPRTIPPEATEKPTGAVPAMEVHQVRFQWDTFHRRWQADCTYGWDDVAPTRDVIEFRAAGHDIREWGR